MMGREASVAKGVRLEYCTLAWNAIEAAVAIAASLFAGSIALLGFGLDSLIELSSGLVLLWRLRSDSEVERRERVEFVAARLVGASFLLLAIYIAFDSPSALWHKQAPSESIPGIIVAAASLVVMPLLARAKRRVARDLGSGAMHADSRQTDVCAYLAAILLAGLILNAALGWWWADPVAGLLMLPLIVNEGRQAWKGHLCCDD
jgi:divalent metal cation (Fe/Co/Zn/Cd) transporter